MKQLLLPIDITESTPQMTIGDREKFEAIKAISPEKIARIYSEAPQPNFIPPKTELIQPGYDFGLKNYGNFWVQLRPFFGVFHCQTGETILFEASADYLPEVADKIAEILT